MVSAHCAETCSRLIFVVLGNQVSNASCTSITHFCERSEALDDEKVNISTLGLEKGCNVSGVVLLNGSDGEAPFAFGTESDCCRFDPPGIFLCNEFNESV